MFCGNLFVLVSFLTFAISVQYLPRRFRINSVCKPPRGEVCVEIRSCPYFADLLDRTSIPRPRRVIKFIKDHQCGFHANTPKVCCSVSQTQSDAADVEAIELTYSPKVSNHKNINLLPSNCGAISNNFRITGGTTTSLLEFPWMALIAYHTSEGLDFRCGGTVINERYVLTAAHCLQNLTFVGVRLGEYNINTIKDCDSIREYCAPPVQDFYIEDIITHPLYNASTFANDIALIRLATPANFSHVNVQPICLPIDDEPNLKGKFAVISGWGVTDEGFKSAVLQKASVNVISTEDCKNLYSRYALISDKQMCAGGYLGRDSCAGDSGGPLKFSYTSNGIPKYVQYGIVSYGPRHCGAEGQPGIYTKVSRYVGWILENLKPDVD